LTAKHIPIRNIGERTGGEVEEKKKKQAKAFHIRG